MKTELILSLIALLVSTITFALSYALSRRVALTDIRPILVFVCESGRGWVLRNVGNGPAINIFIARKGEETEWLDPKAIPPLPKDGEFALSGSPHIKWRVDASIIALGTTYSDFQGRNYSSICDFRNDFLSEIQQGNALT